MCGELGESDDLSELVELGESDDLIELVEFVGGVW